MPNSPYPLSPVRVLRGSDDLSLRNLFACLVHESPECAVDLVRNLRCLDPESGILLYDGSQGGGQLQAFPFARYGAVLHPSPRPLEWGRLHDFALDAMRFALAQLPFDTLTIVDSDQLLVRPGYSEQLARALAGRSGVGLLGNAPGRQPRDTRVGPAAAAYREIDLWRTWLRRFAHGEEAFVHWTFWPSTVFTAAAARDLVTLFDRDRELAEILRRSRIWATEEVVLPTLVALLGHEVAVHPASYDYVQFRQAYTGAQVEAAFTRPDVAWLHPVPRRYDDPLRKQIRERFDHYRLPRLSPGAAPAAARAERSVPGLPSTLSILARIRTIPGWLEDEEADLLIAAAAHALAASPEPEGGPTVVEIGSYCGRSTVLLGSVVQAVCPGGRVVAIDPHRGQVGALDQGLEQKAPTLDTLRGHLAAAGLQEIVEVVPKCSFEVDWHGPIRLLLIDGLHDYVNVARDFLRFEAAVVPGGYVAFHDYASYYPGVRAFIDDLLAGGRYEKVQLAKSLMVVRKLAELAEVAVGRSAPAPPLVSCIMPTADRRAFVPRAIRQFLSQDYPNSELLVIDDGEDRVADLIPPDPRIRYLALDGKRSIGAKRNLACAEARGEILLHWDDDDWMAERRIRVQVEALCGGGAEVSGLPRLYFHEPATGESWEYACPRQDRTWLAGATLCYQKELWRENPFPDTSVGEDTQFLWTDRPKRLAPLDDPSLYVATLHSGNTSSKRTAVAGWRPAPGNVVRRLIGDLVEEAVAVETAPVAPPIHVAAPPAPLVTLPVITAPAAGSPSRARPPIAGRVSCIMPTRADRRRFLLQAVRCFLRQDHPDRELVIVDDGGDSAAGLLPDDPRIVYLHLPGQHSAGHKRNLAVEQSRGEVIVHWDDDDGSAEDRLRHQVQILLERRAEVCGFADETVLDLNDPHGGAFWRCTPTLHAKMFFADVHGRSIAYRRELWGPHRYPDRSLGEDAAFLAAVLEGGARLARVSGAERFLYVRHEDNAWPFRCGEFLDPAGWQAVEPPAFLQASDREFYRLPEPS